MRFRGHDVKSGFRIGGLPPMGILPRIVDERTRYFGTFPICGQSGHDEEISIFTRFEYIDISHPSFLSTHIMGLYEGKENLIQCVFHKPTPRSAIIEFESELQGCAIEIEYESIHFEDTTGHMIGGVPNFDHYHPKVIATASNLLDLGFIHLLQISYPGAKDLGIKGLWPFADNAFHLYIKQIGDDYEHVAILV